jgi:hypothetical protein
MQRCCDWSHANCGWTADSYLQLSFPSHVVSLCSSGYVSGVMALPRCYMRLPRAPCLGSPRQAPPSPLYLQNDNVTTSSTEFLRPLTFTAVVHPVFVVVAKNSSCFPYIPVLIRSVRKAITLSGKMVTICTTSVNFKKAERALVAVML